MSFFREQLESWLKNLDVNAKTVLDIGGSSLPVKDRVRKWDVQEYKIADNIQEKTYIKDFKEPDFKLDLNKWDCCGRHYSDIRDWRLKPRPERRGADIIFCLEVFEYVWNLESAFNALDFLMSNEKDSPRLLIASFPFVYPLHQPASEDYLRYTYNGVLRLLTEHGFALMECERRVDRTGKLVEFYQADGMHCAGDSDVTGYIVTARKTV